MSPLVILSAVLPLLRSVCVGEEVALTDPVLLNKGVKIVGVNGSTYQSFMGIPFAEPPINELRFANPKPKILPRGVFYAVRSAPQCIQVNFLLPQHFVAGDEDCLYLNVYRPHRGCYCQRSRLPVIVYIHGGAFFSGSIDPGIVGPGYFMENRNVILVMMQYRLSALGFLSTGDEASAGNFGLKDQSLALAWVKENIASFGGDPNEITIVGQSAGAASVDMHLLSPLSRGLFSKAIAMSGSAIGPYNYPTENPLQLARKHAAIIGITGADTLSPEDLIQCLRQVPADIIVSTVAGLKFFDVDSLTVYRTVVEPKNLTGAFLTDTPLNLLRSGAFAKVPYMTGLVDAEGAVRAAAIVVNKTLTDAINEDVYEIIPQLMELNLTGEERREFTAKIVSRYLPDTGKIDEHNENSFIQLYTDRSFVYPRYKQLLMLTQHKNLPIFSYHFGYRGENSYSALFTSTNRDFGVVHCDDLIYLFESPLLFPKPLNAEDKAMSRTLVNYFVSFAGWSRYGPWPRTTLEGDRIGPYLSLADNKLRYYEDWDLVRFWDQAQEF